MFIDSGSFQRRQQGGITLIEVLVTIVILAFGLLGLAGLQSKLNLGLIESYQRGQAVVLLEDMAERMKALPAIPCQKIKKKTGNCDSNATNDETVYATHPAYDSTIAMIHGYSSNDVLGTDDEPAEDCSALTSPALRDRCEWSKELQGAAEVKGSDKMGAMVGARGCITELTAPNGTTGVCRPGLYQITVAWQGIHETKEPADSITCGKDEYGKEAYRRAISTRVAIGLPNCQNN